MYKEDIFLEFDEYFAWQNYGNCIDNNHTLNYQSIELHSKIYELSNDELKEFIDNLIIINNTLRNFDEKLYNIVFKDYEEYHNGNKQNKQKGKNKWK